MALSCIYLLFYSFACCLILEITLITAGKLRALGGYMHLLFSPLIYSKIARMFFLYYRTEQIRGNAIYSSKWNRWTVHYFPCVEWGYLHQITWLTILTGRTLAMQLLIDAQAKVFFLQRDLFLRNINFINRLYLDKRSINKLLMVWVESCCNGLEFALVLHQFCWKWFF